MKILGITLLSVMIVPSVAIAQDYYEEALRTVRESAAVEPVDTMDISSVGAAEASSPLVVEDDTIPVLPLEIVTLGDDLRYVTGGIGDEELTMLKAVEDQFNVRILMSSNKGAYISQAALRIFDKDGKEVLADGFAGPYFYAHLPAGKYSVEVVTMKGYTGKGTFTAPAKGFVKPVLRFGVQQ